ncbi:outer membrane protein, OmpA/MotB family [Anaeromyxobacter sp. Fw109-5]|nr:outer membrane protein, OmpA/MotB family [Anaeromyxobacter sp. Fw109-5]
MRRIGERLDGERPSWGGARYDGVRMHRHALPFALAIALGCATAPVEPLSTLTPNGAILRGADLARTRCLLVAPFENASDVALAAEAATSAFVSGVDPSRARVFPIPELREVFRDTPLELPAGIAPSLALELAELVGADAAVYGTVEGGGKGEDAPLLVSVRVAVTGAHRLLFARNAVVRAQPGEAPEDAVRRTVDELARPLLARIGDPGRKQCFDPERTRALRRFALAEPRPDRRAEPQSAPGPAVAPVAATSAPAAAAPRTPRQTEWARKLAAGERLVVDDVAFAGRTAELLRDGGLADLAIALAAAPGVTVRIEAFVDASDDRAGDGKLSEEMARTAGERLHQLGVARARLAWSGRGGESPLLPNFTARGRAANRRIEVAPGR